ncbi:putative mucin TcSMUGL [Trypanosoma cruzi]|uniref:Putative mucin TcSMUGL n=1 Tax=Trypanosoma cruzi TaxID=5693 RepID=A0A2V2V9H0_TRYCR|nr:putative mucin TcSMUGL [Trypanosoma cruzi]
MPCTCPCLFPHAACSRCARPVPARQESLHREQQAKSTKAQVTMMLRRVLCVLFFALCCACVCATAQEEGQYDAAVFKAAGGDPKKNTTTTTTTTTTTSTPNTTPHHYDYYYLQGAQEHDHHNYLPRQPGLLKTRAVLAALCGCRCRCCCLSVPLWRPPVLRAEDGAGRVRRRSGVPLCAATARTRGSTDWRLRRVYLSTLQRCGRIYSGVFGCACWPRAACPCILCDGRALMYIFYRRPATCGGEASVRLI